jgi:membrane-associated phospholipid phosphatase
MTISRIIAGVHYPSDIVGGMIIGIIIAKVSFIYLGVYFKNLWKPL